jgi:uncharacterized membrane protein YfcA
MQIVGFIASALIGISLGLIGGGGSILTVPVLVYLFKIPPLYATSYSLFIVGTTSLVGTIKNAQKGNVNFKTAFLFGMSSIITVYVIRKFLLPLIAHLNFHIASFTFSFSFLVMILFAVLMFASSILMIRNKKTDKTANKEASKQQTSYGKLFINGIAIGGVTGLLGAGGGFLIIPSLVLLMGLSMKEAVGTSLFIIALNSLIGFIGDIGNYDIQWLFLLEITFIAIAGLFIGDAFSKNIPGEQLKKIFGWFILVVGLYILIKELFF